MMVGGAVEKFFRRSVAEAKWSTVHRDIHLREVIDQVSRIGCDLQGIDSYALLTLKAEAILARKGAAVVKWLRHNDFEIVGFVTTRITTDRSRILWRWQLEKATRHRLWVMDNILDATDSVVLVLRRSIDNGMPATAWLSRNKGPANPNNQRVGQLRHILRPSCYLLNFVHTSDDVVDMFRDIYILSGMEGVASLCEIVSTRRSHIANAGRSILHTEQKSLFHDLLLEGSAGRLAHFLGACGRPDAMDRVETAIEKEFSGAGPLRNSPTAYLPIDTAVFVAHRFDMSLPESRDPFESLSGTQ